jgi:hypothetical protein
VHFERGRHATGLSWLTSWCRGRMPTGSEFAPHLSWHAGLLEDTLLAALTVPMQRQTRLTQASSGLP